MVHTSGFLPSLQTQHEFHVLLHRSWLVLRFQRLKKAGQVNLPFSYYFLRPLEFVCVLFVCIWVTARMYLATWTSLQKFPSSISLPSPAPLLFSWPPRLLLSEFHPHLRGNILAAWLYGYRKEESLKDKAGDVIPSFITNSCQNITNHSQTWATVTECKTIKMMEIRRDRHFIETNTFPANR